MFISRATLLCCTTLGFASATPQRPTQLGAILHHPLVSENHPHPRICIPPPPHHPHQGGKHEHAQFRCSEADYFVPLPLRRRRQSDGSKHGFRQSPGQTRVSCITGPFSRRSPHQWPHRMPTAAAAAARSPSARALFGQHFPRCSKQGRGVARRGPRR